MSIYESIHGDHHKVGSRLGLIASDVIAFIGVVKYHVLVLEPFSNLVSSLAL